MNLLSKSSSGTVDTRVMHATQHQHLIIGFVAETTGLANFVHSWNMFYFILIQQNIAPIGTNPTIF